MKNECPYCGGDCGNYYCSSQNSLRLYNKPDSKRKILTEFFKNEGRKVLVEIARKILGK